MAKDCRALSLDELVLAGHLALDNSLQCLRSVAQALQDELAVRTTYRDLTESLRKGQFPTASELRQQVCEAVTLAVQHNAQPNKVPKPQLPKRPLILRQLDLTDAAKSNRLAPELVLF